MRELIKMDMKESFVDLVVPRNIQIKQIQKEN